MARANKKTTSKLHCQHCGKLRAMTNFLAINTEQKDGEKNVFPFKLRKFLGLIQGNAMIRLPKFYAATCSVCFQNTYFQGQNRGTKMEVICT